MFAIMPHRDRTAGYARLTQIDPIQVWINAERRLMGFGRRTHVGTQQKAAGP
ncbi:hypothetical protein QWJ07_13925 [Frankia sp. RB7]|nr:hypothetical protein [Frankia sp. RB7]